MNAHENAHEAPADNHTQLAALKDDKVDSKDKGYDPTSYAGPVQYPGENSFTWTGRTSITSPRPEGHRYAQSQWQLTMSGMRGHEAPHQAYFAMSNEQQRVFDSAGLPSAFIMHGEGGGGSPPPAPDIEAPPPAAPACSQCDEKSSSIKKFATPAGNMRPLCNTCVYDSVGGDQDAFRGKWADGRPL